MTGIVSLSVKVVRLTELVVRELKLKNRSTPFSSFQELPARAEGNIAHETTVISAQLHVRAKSHLWRQPCQKLHFPNEESLMHFSKFT